MLCGVCVVGFSDLRQQASGCTPHILDTHTDGTTKVRVRLHTHQSRTTLTTHAGQRCGSVPPHTTNNIKCFSRSAEFSVPSHSNHQVVHEQVCRTQHALSTQTFPRKPALTRATTTAPLLLNPPTLRSLKSGVVLAYKRQGENSTPQPRRYTLL